MLPTQGTMSGEHQSILASTKPFSRFWWLWQEELTGKRLSVFNAASLYFHVRGSKRRSRSPGFALRIGSDRLRGAFITAADFQRESLIPRLWLRPGRSAAYPRS